MTKTIIVTGGTGLVGKGIQWAVENEDASLHQDERWIYLGSKDCNLTDPNDVERMFLELKPTHVIHLAAKVGGLFLNMSKRAEMWSDNVLMNENILRACNKHKVAKLVSCLSTCVFPDKTTYPIDETMLHNGPPHESNEGYAYAKRMLEVASRCYRDQYGCNFVSVIPTNIFGPHDNFNLEDAHVLPALMHKAYNAKKSGTKFVIKGSGKPLRQFLYSRDLGQLMVLVLRHYDEVSPIVLTPEEEYTIADVAKMVCNGFDYHDIEFDTSASDGQFKKTASAKKLKEFIQRVKPGFELTPLQTALTTTIAWFQENYDTCRK